MRCSATKGCSGEAVEGMRLCAKCQARGRRSAAAARVRDADALNARAAAWRARNPERLAVYREATAGREHDRYVANRDERLARNASYREANREKILEQQRASYRINREARLAQVAAYKAANPEKAALASRRSVAKNADKHHARRRAYVERRLREDPLWKLGRALRSRASDKLRKHMAGQLGKGAIGMRELGCTLEHLRHHLESQFELGMSWDNWSRTGWHIDHRTPLAHFDLAQPEQRARAFHFTNLQPLWAIDNLRKGARTEAEFRRAA